LIEALAANFEGYEDIRQMLLDAPKFGNDDDYVDKIASRLYTDCVKICSEIESCFGAHYVCAPHSLRFHSLFGRKVGALPSGRLAGYSLADGAVSPCQGMDVKGPTATINSAGKVDQVPIFGVLFNMKFHPTSLSTREDLQKFLVMIRTYFHDYGGKHMQFNIVSRETLLEARAHPEEHKGLVVRVAGYSALWVELERTIQDEIIARAEKTW
jgi:pyruvate-formate lyase